VLAPDADLRVVASAAAIEVRDASRSADGLADLHLLRPGRPLNFVHDVVRVSLCEDVPTARRSEIREFAAELLAARGDQQEAAELLLHTEPRNISWVATVLTDAARQAFEDNDVARATRLAERALAETMSGNSQPDLLLMLAQLAANEGDPAAAAHLLQARDEHSDPVAVATTGVQLVDQFWERPMRATLLEILAPVRREIAGVAPELALQLELMTALTDGASLTLPLWGDDCPVVADADVLRLARVVHTVALAADAEAVDFDTTLRTITDNLTLDTVSRARTRWATAAVLRGVTALVRMGVTTDIDPVLKLLQAETARNGNVLDSAKAAIHLAESLSLQGRLQEADDTLVAAAPAAEQDPAWHNLMLVSRARIMALRGARDRAMDLLASVDGVDWQALGPLNDSHAAESCGHLRVMGGQWSAALDDFAQAEAMAHMRGIANPALSDWRAGRVEALVALGNEQAARELAEANVDLAERFGARVPLSRALRGLARAADDRERLKLLEQSLALLEGAVCEVDRCMTLIDLGCAHLGDGQVQPARTVLRTAGDLAARIGATALMTRASDALRQAGARPRRLHLRGSDSLTPSERRVALLAAQGHTNTAIASMLFISLKTVESHLARSYRKLGVRSRAELTRLLGQPRASGAGSTSP